MSELTDKLLTYPLAIQIAEKNLLELTEDVEQKYAAEKEHILTFNASIAANPSFKNELQRKDELNRQMKESPAYLKAKSDAEQAAYNKELASIDLEYLKNMFRAYLAIVGGQPR